jgi:hypothetical protein
MGAFVHIKPYYLGSLRGEVASIEQLSLAEEHKRLLYLEAATNGHRAALDKLTPEDVGEAFIRAARNNYLPTIMVILIHCGVKISVHHQAITLKFVATNGHLGIVDILLRCWRKMNSRYIANAMIGAAGNGHLELVQSLLKCRAALSTDDIGLALTEAAKEGHLPVVLLLLKEAGVKLKNTYKGLAFWRAARHGHRSMVRTLLSLIGQVLLKESKGNAFKSAAKHGRLGVVEDLLEQLGAEIADFYEPAFEAAAKEGHAEVIRLFLTRREVVISIKQKRSAFNDAAMNGHCKVIEVIIEKARECILMKDLYLAQTVAARYGHDEVLPFLMQECRNRVAEEINDLGNTFKAMRFFPRARTITPSLTHSQTAIEEESAEPNTKIQERAKLG